MTDKVSFSISMKFGNVSAWFICAFFTVSSNVVLKPNLKLLKKVAICNVNKSLSIGVAIK